MKIILMAFGLLVFGSYLHAQTNQDFVLYEDTTRFSSLEQILALPEFKDKVVYIDMWGTRCGPCIQEFAYAPELKSAFAGKPVVFLYLKSPYTFDDSKEWKEMIRKYDLKGVHVAMSISFYMDGFWDKYKKHYSERRMYTIPTYLVADRSGNIFSFDAPRPSSKTKLYRLIERRI